MNVQEKRDELIRFFREKLRDQTEEIKAVDESQKELLELEMQKTTFSLLLLEDGSTVFNDQKIDLSDTKIELMYRNYIEHPM